jgi:UDP-N-acetyl-D-mannosaminuronic acid dehydrogenase
VGTPDVVVVGGCGHVGLPLALVFADRGLDVTLFDVDADAVALVDGGALPFDEPGAEVVLARVLAEDRLRATTDAEAVGRADVVIVVIGTPIDEHLNPDLRAVRTAVGELAGHLRDGQLLILRSTVYPGVTAMVERHVAGLGLDIDVAFCPERIAEGRAMTELTELPQIVAARTPHAADRAAAFFEVLTDDIVRLEPEEAELAKLFTNAWRYIRFATANQLFMMANDFGLDYERIRAAVTHNYPRAADLPGAGFAAGPCLLKDTMQLAAFNNNNFQLGQASVNTNEGLPLYVVAQLERQHDLSTMTVGILGMAFKGESDDARASLSYKLKQILEFKAAGVVTTDPYVRDDPALLPLGDVLATADLLVIGAPHDRYRDLATDVPVVDIWNLRGGGSRV